MLLEVFFLTEKSEVSMSMISRDPRVLDYTMRVNTMQLESSNLTASQNRVSSLNGRMVVNAGDDCFDCITSIPKMIGKFFTQRYADCIMFFRAYTSMGGGTTSRAIDRRVNEVTQFMTVVETCGANRNTVRDRFQRLSPQVRHLFFNVDQNYIDEFIRNPSQETLDEILRECNQVIIFQRQLTAVNTFYRMFVGIGGHTSVTTVGSTTTHRQEPISDDFPWYDWVGGFLPDGFRPRPPGITVVWGHSEPATSTHAFNLNVPGTVAYDQNAIPPVVQQKADEITRLRGQFAGLRNPPPIPLIYNDIIMAEDFMAIPIFDASHPTVQNALSSGATTAINNRDIRHLFDKEALEGHIRAGSSWSPAKCPSCRHPEHGGIRRQYLRIDTALQDEILQFLRTAMASGGSTTR
jgi:hypothetical protein